MRANYVITDILLHSSHKWNHWDVGVLRSLISYLWKLADFHSGLIVALAWIVPISYGRCHRNLIYICLPLSYRSHASHKHQSHKASHNCQSDWGGNLHWSCSRHFEFSWSHQKSILIYLFRCWLPSPKANITHDGWISFTKNQSSINMMLQIQLCWRCCISRVTIGQNIKR